MAFVALAASVHKPRNAEHESVVVPAGYLLGAVREMRQLHWHCDLWLLNTELAKLIDATDKHTSSRVNERSV